jgi:cyclopropane-fatty-acyl-phospholipid synthase
MFRRILSRIISVGSLELIGADGRKEIYGNGAEPKVTLKIQKPSVEWTVLTNPLLRFPEAVMEGSITVEQGSIRDLMRLLMSNDNEIKTDPFIKTVNRLLRQGPSVRQFNPLHRARKNVAHHYDLSGQLYDLFLDPDKQYSCAYFRTPETSLETAQVDKKRHIASKLLLDQPDLEVLDIGSGWGGMGLYLAQEAGSRVTGVTLSVEQHKISQERAREAGLEDRCRFELRDYREETRSFDRIVSVGMFEHVGKKNYDEFFGKIGDLMTDDGVCLLHSIGDSDEPAPTNPFIRKYIFPGCDVPSLSEVTAAVERAGLFITDIEILRLHYAETLRHWYQRFLEKRDEARALYDERFCRMWELYLTGCEMSFRYQGLMVFQMQISKRLETVPLTRDYMVDWERAHGADAQAQAAE